MENWQLEFETFHCYSYNSILTKIYSLNDRRYHTDMQKLGHYLLELTYQTTV